MPYPASGDPRKRPRKSRGWQNNSADFETTTDPDDCRVWSWGFVNVATPDQAHIIRGRSIDEFIRYICTHNSRTYFHNLKFDGRFLVDWLLRNDYTHAQDNGPLPPKWFHTLINDTGAFYSVTVKWENGNTTEFRDSYKKIPLPVSRIPEAYKLETSKGEIDYHKERPIGYWPSEDEWDYLDRDILIVAEALRQTLEAGMKKLTVASDALTEYKALIGDKMFRRRFPVLDFEMDMEIRRAYRGGFTYVADRFRGKRMGCGVVLDVNSLYPSVMYNEVLPFGEPVPFSDAPEFDPDYPLSIFSVTFTAKLKPGHIPCIQIKSSTMFNETEYLKSVDEPTTLMMTNIDFALYQDHYDMQVLAYNGGWKFHGARGMFDAYIDKWSTIKVNSVGGMREIAKLYLNSLYGKFVSRPVIKSKYPVLSEETNTVRLVSGPEERVEPVYTPVGVFITSYARNLTIRAGQDNYDVFAYADTDSLHLLTPDVPESLDVHETRMGAWKLENRFFESYYVRPKAYLERINETNVHKDTCEENCAIRHDFKNAWAGLPQEISSSMTFDDLVEGRVMHGKLIPKAVPGGMVLKDVPYELKDLQHVETV